MVGGLIRVGRDVVRVEHVVVVCPSAPRVRKLAVRTLNNVASLRNARLGLCAADHGADLLVVTVLVRALPGLGQEVDRALVVPVLDPAVSSKHTPYAYSMSAPASRRDPTAISTPVQGGRVKRHPPRYNRMPGCSSHRCRTAMCSGVSPSRRLRRSGSHESCSRMCSRTSVEPLSTLSSVPLLRRVHHLRVVESCSLA